MGLIEKILHRSPVILPEGGNNPLDTFLQVVNFGLERTLGRGSFHQHEQKVLLQALRNPACEELDQATRKRLDSKGITSSFWNRILVFSSHEECFLPGHLSFVYDRRKRLFVLRLGNALINTQNVQILCHPLERFNEQRVQAKFTVQQNRQKSIPTLNMLLGIDEISKRERILFVIARYRDGHPQISFSVLNLDSDWKELFDDTGKLKTAQTDIAQPTSQRPELQRPASLTPGELPLLTINEILKREQIIKTNEQIGASGVFQPQVIYSSDEPQIPVFIVARSAEIDPTRIISIADKVEDETGNHNLQVTLNSVFPRCPRETVMVPFSQKGNVAILLTLNPRVFMPTPSGGFYRKEKGIIAIPFELP